MISPEEEALLAQLGDVVLPLEPGWWPPAVGWWVLLILIIFVLLMLVAAVVLIVVNKRRQLWKKTALSDHQRIRENVGTEDGDTVLEELSVLMRRVALAVYPRSNVAAVTDEDWLETLDSIANTSQYSTGVGQILYRRQYQRTHKIESSELLRLLDLTELTIKNATRMESKSPREVSVVAL